MPRKQHKSSDSSNSNSCSSDEESLSDDDDLCDNDDDTDADNTPPTITKNATTTKTTKTATKTTAPNTELPNSSTNLNCTKTLPKSATHALLAQPNGNKASIKSTKSFSNCFDVTQFSRSCIGSSKYLVNAHLNIVSDDDLVFESRFESGNLAKAIKITPVYYELYLRPDLYTNKHTQWFYFRVTNVKKGITYRYLNVFHTIGKKVK